VVVVLGVALVLSISRMAMAAAPMTADEVAQACIDEIHVIDIEMTHAVGMEALYLAGAVNGVPAGTPISHVFKLASAASGRIDKIAAKAASRVEKSSSKCSARIDRLGGDGSLYTDIAVAHDQAIASIDLNVNYRQGHVAGVVTDYIAAQ
jgi:hypothetical protein